MKEYEEAHQEGLITIENIPDELRVPGYMPHLLNSMQGDFGIQIARDGRVWVCINGIAFLRFKPLGVGSTDMATEAYPPTLTKTSQGWRVGQQYRDKNYTRHFHYKRDAEVFTDTLLKTKETYGESFHPGILHMYEEQGGA